MLLRALALAALASAAAASADPAAGCVVEYSTRTIATEAAPDALTLGPRPVPAAFVGQGDLTLVSHKATDLPVGAKLAVEFASPAVVGGGAGLSRAAAPASSPRPDVKSYEVAPSAVNGAGHVSVGYEVVSPSSDYAPTRVTLGGAPCTLRPAAASVPPSPPTELHKLANIPGGVNKFLAEKPVSTRGSQFIGVDGAPFTIKGVNWFGYENGQTNPDGLWGKVDDAIVADFVNVVWRMQLLGFNTIRLPFSFRDLESATPKDPKYATCKAITDAEMAASVTPKGVTPPAGPVPQIKAPVPKHDPAVCNDYVPMDSMRNRFFWAMRYIASNGFYVVIDDHLAYDTLVLDDAAKWVASWKSLAADIAKDPLLKNRVMLDLLNEPDARGIKWSTGPKQVGMTKYYVDAMDAIYSVHPTALMLVEGCGQLGTVAMNWGDGYATDATIVKAGGVDDARPFFETIMTKPYANNVVISPHIYPPSISTHNEPDVVLAPGLFTRLDNSYGYLTKKGFCPTAGGPCKQFPVVYGETGAKFDKELDVKMLEDFAKYMTSDTAGHAPTPNMIWWTWNANSGDTGGIVNDQWKEIQWFKIGWLMRAAGLAPWALGGKPLPAALNQPPVGSVAPSVYGLNSAFDQSGGAAKPTPAPTAAAAAKPAPLPPPVTPPPVAAAPVAAPAPAPTKPPPAKLPCEDVQPPSSQYSCDQQAAWGKCGESWMVGFCKKACGRCPTASVAQVEAFLDAMADAGASAPAVAAAAAPAAAPRQAAAAPTTAPRRAAAGAPATAPAARKPVADASTRAAIAADTAAVAQLLAVTAEGAVTEPDAADAIAAVLADRSPAQRAAVLAQLEAADEVAAALEAAQGDADAREEAAAIMAAADADGAMD